MSEWKVETIKIGEINKLPNADTLSITTTSSGYPCIIKTGEFHPGDFATYVPIDSLVPTDHPYFSFLSDGKKSTSRIKARKLRGTFSAGLIVPYVEGTMEGDDVSEQLGVTKYLPPAEREFGGTPHDKTHKERRSETWPYEKKVWTVSVALGLLSGSIGFPWGYLVTIPIALEVAWLLIKYNRKISKRPTIPVYDIDGYRRYSNIVEDGEHVVLTEKVHGSNCRFIHTGKKFHVGSRTMFRPKNSKTPGIPGYEVMDKDLWWLVAEKYDLERKLATKPGYVLFGEMFGPKIQDLDYGVKPDDVVEFMAFDVMNSETRQYLSVPEFLEFCRELDIPTVPVLYQGPFSTELISLADGKTVINGAKHMKEGWVLKPIQEKRHPLIGRFILKYASETFLTRKNAS